MKYLKSLIMTLNAAALFAAPMSIYSSEVERPQTELKTVQEDIPEQVENALNEDYTSHPGSYHQIYAIFENGRSIQLTDGSLWEVTKENWEKVYYNWNAGDTIAITQPSYWSSSSYVIDARFYNTVNWDVIDMRLLNLPNGNNRTFVIREIINLYGYAPELILDDGSRWKLYSSESHIWQKLNGSLKWKPGHVIIIGNNDSINPWRDPNILFNLNDGMKFITTRCLN
jgi:hypothetical protein